MAGNVEIAPALAALFQPQLNSLAGNARQR